MTIEINLWPLYAPFRHNSFKRREIEREREIEIEIEREREREREDCL